MRIGNKQKGVLKRLAFKHHTFRQYLRILYWYGINVLNFRELLDGALKIIATNTCPEDLRVYFLYFSLVDIRLLNWVRAALSLVGLWRDGPAPVHPTGSENYNQVDRFVVEKLQGTVLPSLAQWPLKPFTGRVARAALEISLELNRLDETSAMFLKESPVWKEWQDCIYYWSSVASCARFDQGHLLATLAPFIHLHSELVVEIYGAGSVEAARLGESHSQLITELMTDFWVMDYAIPPKMPRIYAGFANVASDRMFPIVEGLYNFNGIEELEAFVAQILTLGFSLEDTDFERSICLRIPEIVNEIQSSRWKGRRKTRLILSLVSVCKECTDLDIRRNSIFKLIPADRRWISMPSEREAAIAKSKSLMQDLESEIWKLDICIRFDSSPQEEESGCEADRNRWLTILFEHFFAADFCDGTIVFLKRCIREELICIGILIGLSIRYQVPIGVKFDPSVIAFMQSPSLDAPKSFSGQEFHSLTHLVRGLHLVIPPQIMELFLASQIDQQLSLYLTD